MAKPKPAQKPQTFQFKGYVRCELQRSEEDDFKAWSNATSETDLFALLLEAADSGYKVSVGEAARGMCATMANTAGPEATRGFVLSAFGGSPERALRGLMYKHHVKLEADWPDDGVNDGWDLG